MAKWLIVAYNPANYSWLVVTGTMEFYDFPETVGNVIIPTDEIIFFTGVETTNQIAIW